MNAMKTSNNPIIFDILYKRIYEFRYTDSSTIGLIYNICTSGNLVVGKSNAECYRWQTCQGRTTKVSDKKLVCHV